MSLRAPHPSLLAVAALLASACGTNSSTDDCGSACPAGFFCSAGACIPDTTSPDAGAAIDMATAACNPPCTAPAVCGPMGRCVACVEDAQCPLGQVCKNTGPGGEPACAPGCVDDKRCEKGLACCAGQCVDTGRDANHCGACGMACKPVHAGSSCAGGKCVIGACSSGWADCNADAGDGCETNLRIDKDHCGACDTKCAFAHGLAACAFTCYLAACEFGHDDCNGKDDDGCETPTESDARNCGACGKACPLLSHARAGCANGACNVAACDMGWADCDRQAANGCETNVGTDVGNCGACGNVCQQGLVCVGGGCTCMQCNIPNASARCANNQCVFDKCNPGFLDCDNNQGNGCEVSGLADAKNCGACGKVCGNGLSCVAGMCSAIIGGCNATGLGRGCVSVADGCWCKTGGPFSTGREVCGYPPGYAGTYYSMNGRDSQNPNGPMDGTRARAILAALRETPSPNHCNAQAAQGSCSQTCSCDCATNILASDNGASWGTSMSCWNDQQRWDRGTNIVRCVSFEQ